MKRLLLIVILFCVCITVFGQVQKRFLDKNDKYITDSVKAKAYILYQKENDSLYSAVELDMRNTPIFKGAFSDESLTIPQGKFVYYEPVEIQKKVDEHHVTLDTSFTIIKSGYFDNGLKQGIWVEYDIMGVKKSITNYQDGKKNGALEYFYVDGKLKSTINYIDDLREGDSFIFRQDSSIEVNVYYMHNKIVYFDNYGIEKPFYRAYPGFNFENYLNEYLQKLNLPYSKGHVLIGFVIAADGKVMKPELNMGINPVLDKAIIDALTNSPNWHAAKKNKERVDQKITLAIQYTTR
jgi:hypothetical protein